MRRPIRPSTSRGTTPRRSSRSSRASPSASRSIRRRSMSRASPRSRRRTSRRPTNSATGSSCSASRSIPARASSSACIRPWCRKDSAIAQVMGVTNAVTVDADAVHAITLVGPGAGGMATASAVVADIGDIARGVRTPPFGRATDQPRGQPEGADAAPRGRLLHPPAGARQARHRRHHRAPPRPAGDLAGIDRAAPPGRGRMAATIRTRRPARFRSS